MSNTDLERMMYAFRTDTGQIMNDVAAHLFTPTGKWKYDVSLDYTDIWHRIISRPARDIVESTIGRPEFLAADDAALMALERATERGTSGVSVKSLGDYWTLVVPDPPNGWPIMVSPSSEGKRP